MSSVSSPLIASFPQPPVLVGYCLGGTLAMAAAARSKVAGWPRSPRRGTSPAMATKPGRDGCAMGGDQADFRSAGPRPHGGVAGGLLAARSARTIAKYAAFAELDPRSEAARRFIRLEDWANRALPCPCLRPRAVRGADRQDRPGRDSWRIAGATVTPAQCDAPSVEFIATADRIVPGRHRHRPARPASGGHGPCRHGRRRPCGATALAAARRLDHRPPNTR